ncbi:MAG: hypothetical protein IJZ74_07135 [Clostridia bacterium]|nr:hypothetical protein [Clostridia bacterium]
MNRLYIVEGLPCSGKSTTASFIAATLAQRGQTVRCIDEGTGNHPADYEYHALHRGRIVSLADCPPEQLTELMPCKIYDGLPWETEAPLMLDKWRQFVRDAEESVTHVFNCVLLQNPMCETMMRFNLNEEASAAHIRRIADIIRPLDPVVVYLHVSDIAGRVQQTAAERPGWLDAVIPYHADGGYGRSIGAAGFNGYIACLEERQRREERILQTLPLRRITLTDPYLDWSGAHACLKAAL